MSGNWKKANFEKLSINEVVRLITTPALMTAEFSDLVEVTTSGNTITITISGYAIDEGGNVVKATATKNSANAPRNHLDLTEDV